MSKTETMAFIPLYCTNIKKKNIISRLCSTNEKTKSLGLRIGLAFVKWNKLKHDLTDRYMKMPIRVKFLHTCVRSRLLCSVQIWQLTDKGQAKIKCISWFPEKDGEWQVEESEG